MKIKFFIATLCLFGVLHGHAQKEIKADDSIYVFKGKLVDRVSLGPFCGDVSFNVGFKFEISETTHPELMNKNVVIVFQCPREVYGTSFFIKGRSYNLKTTLKKETSLKGVVMQADYAKENLPVFWNTEIKILEK